MLRISNFGKPERIAKDKKKSRSVSSLQESARKAPQTLANLKGLPKKTKPTGLPKKTS